MIRPRIIPCLLLRDKGLVKTVQFDSPKYIGDPINAVRIFNEKEVDELIMLDIDATKLNREPEYNIIKKVAAECAMPFCYGGGIKNIDQAKKIIGLGVEKISISSEAVLNPKLIGQLSKIIGNQSVNVVLDVKKSKIFGKYELFICNGKKKAKHNVFEFAKMMEEEGVGEIIINSIDRDGTMAGFDYELIDRARNLLTVPMTVLGGAGSYDDLKKIVEIYGPIGVSAGSLFVYKGIYKAVLINYPSHSQKNEIFSLSI